MGKSKGRGRRSFHSRLNNPLRDDGQSRVQQAMRSTAMTNDAKSIYVDLVSLDEKRRQRACQLLSSIYDRNANNFNAINKMTTPEILSKLCMRLVDSSTPIRVDALRAVTGVAMCQHPELIGRMMECGIIDIVMSLTTETCTTMSDEKYLVELLSCLASIIAATDVYAMKVLSDCQSLLEAIKRQLQSDGCSSTLRLAILNLLFVCTDNFPEMCAKVQQSGLAEHVSSMAKLAHRKAYSANSLVPSQMKSAVIDFKYMGIAFNIYTCSAGTVEGVALDVGDLIASCLSVTDVTGVALQEMKTQFLTPAEGDAQITDAESMEKRVCFFELMNIALEILTNASYLTSESLGGGDDAMEVEAGADADIAALPRDFIEAVANSFLVGHALPRLAQCSAAVAHALQGEGVLKDALGAEGSCEYLCRLLENADRLSCYAVNVLPVLASKPEAFGAVDSATSSTALGSLISSYVAIANVSLDTQAKITAEIQAASSAKPSTGDMDVATGGAEMQTDMGMGAGKDGAAASQAGEVVTEEINMAVVDIDKLSQLALDVGISTAGALSALLRLSPAACLRILGEAAPEAAAAGGLMQPLVLLLCKAISGGKSAVMLPLCDAAGSLGAKDIEIETHSGRAGEVISERLNALLTNCLLRKMESALSSSSGSASSPSPNVDPVSAAILSNSKNALAIEACLSAIIDLHSSDSEVFLQNYRKLSVSERIRTAAQGCRAAEAALRKQQLPKYQHLTLSPADSAKIQETLTNAKNFIEYKASYL